MESSLNPGLLVDIMAEHIVFMVMVPIMEVPPNRSSYIDYVSYMDLRVLLCLYKYMEVNKAWHLHFGMEKMHNTFGLVLFEFGLHDPYTFIIVKGMILLDKAIRKYLYNRFIFNITQPIVIPIEWQVQHTQLNNIGTMQLQYFRDMLAINRDYCNGHPVELWQCNNYWICLPQPPLSWTYSVKSILFLVCHFNPS